MGRRDWGRQRANDLLSRARTERTLARYISDREAPAAIQQISKADLRAQADAALAEYRGPIKPLPMIAALRCRTCGHRGNARVPAGKSPSFRCSACGSSLVAWRV